MHPLVVRTCSNPLADTRPSIDSQGLDPTPGTLQEAEPQSEQTDRPGD